MEGEDVTYGRVLVYMAISVNSVPQLVFQLSISSNISESDYHKPVIFLVRI